jgi:hypothetical protein
MLYNRRGDNEFNVTTVIVNVNVNTSRYNYNVINEFLVG